MEKQFNPIQVAHWLNTGLSQADAEFLASVQFEGYQIDLDASWEQDATPEGDFDKETARQVRKQMNAGNVWAWCTVKVSVGFGLPFDDDTEDDYLGCCSYADRNDFIVGGYFVDMVSTCYKALKARETVNA